MWYTKGMKTKRIPIFSEDHDPSEEHRHIVTIIHLLNYGTRLITRVLDEFFEWFFVLFI